MHDLATLGGFDKSGLGNVRHALGRACYSTASATLPEQPLRDVDMRARCPLFFSVLAIAGFGYLLWAFLWTPMGGLGNLIDSSGKSFTVIHLAENANVDMTALLHDSAIPFNSIIFSSQGLPVAAKLSNASRSTLERVLRTRSMTAACLSLCVVPPETEINLPLLRQLLVTDCEMADSTFLAMTESGALTKIELVDEKKLKFRPETISDVVNRHQLTQFTLFGFPTIQTSQFTIDPLAVQKLRDLTLTGDGINDLALRQLSTGGGLRLLSINHTVVTDDEVAHTIAMNPKLSDLTIFNCAISIGTLEKIKSTLTDLKILTVSGISAEPEQIDRIRSELSERFPAAWIMLHSEAD